MVSDHQTEFEKCLDHYERELGSLRTGRAHPALLDAVKVEAYGTEMELKGVASVSVSDPRTLLVEPWDKGLIKAVEKGIAAARLGLNPVSDAGGVRVSLPQLTEENRKELVKVMRNKTEEARVAVRAVRERARAATIEAEKSKTISEDERYRRQEELDKMTRQFVEEIERIAGQKEQEIMTV